MLEEAVLHLDRERVLDRGGGLPLPASGRAGDGGDRGAGRKVGRDDQGARRPAPGSGGDRARADRLLSEPDGALQMPDLGGAARLALAHGDRQAPEVQAARALLGRPRPPRELSRAITPRRAPSPGLLARWSP